MACTRERPEQHNYGEGALRAEHVNQLASACVHQGIREKECRLQSGELRVAQWDVFAYRVHRDRQGLSIEVADRYSDADQDRELPPHNLLRLSLSRIDAL